MRNKHSSTGEPDKTQFIQMIEYYTTERTIQFLTYSINNFYTQNTGKYVSKQILHTYTQFRDHKD